ncbi:MAG TPA: hypothetical protein DCR93_06915, partial [Cytophagales bacterium]|nr:hypothetical protein [Cytophagales bacterium]
MVNYCKRIEGWASDNVPKFKSAQVGLVNLTKEQNAFQFGLINIYKRGSRGISMGLLNLGGLSWISYYANERNYSNVEFATGNTLTKLHRGTVWRWSTYNTLGFSIGGWEGKTREISWGAGAMLEDTGAVSFRSTARIYYPWEAKNFSNWQGLYGSWGVSAGVRPGDDRVGGIQIFLSPTLNWHMLGTGELATPPPFSLPIGDRFC